MTWLSQIPPRGRALSPEERERLDADAASLMEQSHLFRTLDANGRGHLLQAGYVLELGPEEVLIQEGEEGQVMYLVLDGQLRVETGTGTNAVGLAALGRGACVGEVAVLSGRPRTATVRAIAESRVLAFEAHRIQRVLAAHPDVRARLEALVDARARDAADKLIGVPG